MGFFDFLSGVSIGSLSLSRLLSAVVILVICIVAGKIINALVRRFLAKSKLERALEGFIVSAVKVVLWMLTAIITAESLGIPGTSLIAAFSVAGLAVSLSVQNILSNLFSGLTILVTKPFAAGDFIETENASGTVQSVALFHTVLKTPDNKVVYVPNGDMTKSHISNCSREDWRRVDLFFRASFDSDAAEVKKALLQAASEEERVLPEPAPQIVLTSLEDGFVKYCLRVRVKTSDYWDAYFGLNEKARELFERAGIKPAYEHMNVHIQNDR
ncbi:MAG: mechanosensitive ion channel family protein [Oscillospiraceae bacterium]|nr:mechanosensitive ion channel family protein [Oscillospiraceae bacterium]